MSENGLTRELGILLLKKMREIRQFSERIIRIYPTDVVVTPVHLCIGQEAVPVGVCTQLKASDTIFFGHRTHGPALAKGMDMKKLMAELYGRTTGCSHGYGGSMHLIDTANGMLGSSAIVGGGIALGVGSALAAKLRNEDRISISYFGDGAADSGVLWESMNFAALKKVPVLFVCENNFLSNVMPKSDHLFVELTSVAKEFMPASCADGTDVLAVYTAAKEAINYVRSSGHPAFLECTTKRWMKHQGVERDDLPYNLVDPKRDCPIRKLEQILLKNNLMTLEELQEIADHIELRIDEAVEFALQSPFPKESDLVKEV
jgi:TPP-dependent pyruvate/acetoin dehydrogenase alpha subunit